MAETNHSIGAKDQPITRHPLFPAIVALWCGALAGLGSVMLSTSAIESLVVSLGVDKVVPMAAPPLGTTMRIVLALVLTGLGAAIGALVARRIMRSAAVAQADEISEDAEAAQPDGEGAMSRRRRPLAVAPAAAPLVDEHAPLPGQATQAPILNVADFDIDSFDDATDSTAPRAEGHVDRRWAAIAREDVDEGIEDIAAPAWLAAGPAWLEPSEPETALPKAPQVFQAELDAADEAAREEEAPVGSRLFEAYSRELSPRSSDVAESESTMEKASPGFTLLPRLPHGDWEATETAPHSDEGNAPFAAPVIADTFAAEPDIVSSSEDQPAAEMDDYRAAAAIPASSAASRIADAELASLSQVELVERLALAMARRREEARQAAEQTLTAPEMPVVGPFAAPTLAADVPNGETIDARVIDSEGTDQSSWAPPAAEGLYAVEPARDHNDDDDGPRATSQAIPFPTSPFPNNRFNPQPDGDEGEDEDDTVLRQGYSSLLNLSRHAVARKPVLRFSEPDDAGDDFAHANPPLHDVGPFAAGFAPAAPADDPAPSGQAENVQDTPPAPRAFDAPRKDDPDATEKALRAALATLQRMSGAA